MIAQRFQSDGVNEVVAVGDGSAIWPQGLSAIQSTYNPSWVATNESDFSGDVGADYNPIYLKNVVTSTPLTPPEAIWQSPGTQQCVRLDRKDYPSNHINAYDATLPESEETWLGIELACTDMALFTDIAQAAGKNLTVDSFVKAGYGLRNVLLPGTNAHHFVRPRTGRTHWDRCTWCTTTRPPRRWSSPTSRRPADVAGQRSRIGSGPPAPRTHPELCRTELRGEPGPKRR